MSIIVRDTGSTFNPAPQGLHRAVCVDVVDLGSVETAWGSAPMVQLRWEIEEIDRETGRPYMLVARYRASLNSKANLYKLLVAWRGKEFTKDELEGFDLEVLVGVNCQLQVVHAVKDGGRTYANVQAVVPPAKGMEKLLPSAEYVRVKDRGDHDHGGGPDAGAGRYDDEVPF